MLIWMQHFKVISDEGKAWNTVVQLYIYMYVCMYVCIYTSCHLHTCFSLSPPAPCVPTHVTARVDCQTGITSVTWDSARGAKSYTVFAWGSLGHNATCNGTDTNCNFLSLACGQVYNITVLARHDSCVSLISESISVSTGNKMKADGMIQSWGVLVHFFLDDTDICV